MLGRMVLDGIAALKFLLGGEFANFTAVFKAHLSYYSMLGQTRKKRRALLPHVKHVEHNEIYFQSIIADFYLRNKKRFSELRF